MIDLIEPIQGLYILFTLRLHSNLLTDHIRLINTECFK